MRRTPRLLLTALLAAATLTACSDDAEDAAPAGDEATDADADAATADDAAADGEVAQEPAPADAGSPIPGATDGPDEVHELLTLDNGVQVAVGPAWVDADLVGIPVAAWNGSEEEIALGEWGPNLVDDASPNWAYEFQPPSANAELRIPSGEVLRGTLVFHHTEEELPQDPGRFHLEITRLGPGNPSHEFRDLPSTRVG